MNQFNEQLEYYQQQVIRKRRLDSIIKSLKGQQLNAEKKVEELAKILKKEENDVKKVESLSLSSIWLNILGKRDERIDKEKREAYAAMVKYNVAKNELEEINKDIFTRQKEYNSLYACENNYKKVFEEKANYIKANNYPNVSQIIDLENKILYLNNQIKEFAEAIEAGKKVLESADKAKKCLSSADSLSTWDMLTDSFLVDVEKHAKLDDAQTYICKMQVDMRKFKTELNDVNLDANIVVNISGFTKFADYFFDGLFMDWSVKNHIKDSLDKVNNIFYKVKNIINKLTNNSNLLDKEIRKLESEYDRLVRDC